MNKTALISGASGGLGLSFAKIFAKENYDLVLVARNKEKLLEVKIELEKEYKIFVTIIAKDLSKSSAAEELYKELENKEINVLVNNAGFATHGEFLSIPLNDEVDELMLNIVAPTSLTKLIVKDMVAKGEGKILNIASTAAFIPGPLMAVYYASKAYVLSFSESLFEELKGTGVSVTALCPGPTDTGFAKRANMQNTTLYKTDVMSADRVAMIGFEALMKRRRVVIAGLRNNFLYFFEKYTPHFLSLSIVKKAQL